MECNRIGCHLSLWMVIGWWNENRFRIWTMDAFIRCNESHMLPTATTLLSQTIRMRRATLERQTKLLMTIVFRSFTKWAIDSIERFLNVSACVCEESLKFVKNIQSFSVYKKQLSTLTQRLPLISIWCLFKQWSKHSTRSRIRWDHTEHIMARELFTVIYATVNWMGHY